MLSSGCKTSSTPPSILDSGSYSSQFVRFIICPGVSPEQKTGKQLARNR